MHRDWSIILFEYKHINTHLKSIDLKLTFLEEKMKTMNDNTYKKKIILWERNNIKLYI